MGHCAETHAIYPLELAGSIFTAAILGRKDAGQLHQQGLAHQLK